LSISGSWQALFIVISSVRQTDDSIALTVKPKLGKGNSYSFTTSSD